MAGNGEDPGLGYGIVDRHCAIWQMDKIYGEHEEAKGSDDGC
jgi:hypothetical protein